MADRCTRVDIFDLVTRWEVSYGRFDIGKDLVVEEWMRHLRTFDPDILAQAVDAIVNTWQEKARPKVGDLRRAALRILGGAEKHTTGPAPEVCVVCGAHRWFAGYQRPDGEVFPRMRCLCSEGPGWDTPEAQAWAETDPGLLAAGYRPHPEFGGTHASA